MEGFEIDACLNSMTILVDTREQPSERAEKRYKSFQCSWRRQKLDYGDYSVEFMDSNNQWVRIPVAIERKMNLEELSSCFCQSRDRFTREFERAKEQGAKIYLLTENATWEKLINGKYNTKYSPKAYFASITAFMARYNITPIFCKEEISGKLIREILYRELKERLERGEYDG